MKARRDANHASPAEGAHAAISALTAEKQSRVSGHKLTEEEETFYGARVSVATERELRARGKFEVLKPAKEGALSKSVMDILWAPSWKLRRAKRT